MVSETRAATPDGQGEGFPPGRRLRIRREFLETYEGGRRFGGRFVVLFACPEEGSCARVGLTVTKKVGRAALRNRLRRRVREILRRSPVARRTPPCRIVVNISPRAVEASYSDLRADIENLLTRAGRALA